MNDLFSRAPTDDEKRHYIRIWGGYSANRLIGAMLIMFAIGLMAGFSIGSATS